ncbi:MAG: DUF4097 family beta strand repeat-containing protein [Cytophagales bacterium]|nr:DUF4097 family beta strand repeat-containing protein [Cytophagales bacterium]
MKSPLLLLILTCFALHANGQKAIDEQVFTVNTSTLQSLHLHNMNGPVSVKGVEGKVASLKIKRSLESISNDRLEEAKGSITFDSITVDDKMYFFMKHPDINFEIDENGFGHYNSCCNRNNDRKHVKVKYEFEIELQLPKQLDLQVSTHRKPLKIKDIDGNLMAKNHHNDLLAENLGGKAELQTHHGDIKASFVQNPSDACSYATHHGDITIEFRPSLAANVYLKSHHGEFFTDFDWTPQPVALVKNDVEKGTKYVVNARTAIQIGGGGPEQKFKTWHGDIYLLKAKQ